MRIWPACCTWRSISDDARNWINAYKRLAPQTRQLEASVGRQDALAAMVQSIEAISERVQRGLVEATFEQRRLLVELLIDRVIVTNEEGEIRYVIPPSPGSEQVRFCHLRLDYFYRPVLAYGGYLPLIFRWQTGQEI